MLSNQITKLAQQRAALARRHLRPGSLGVRGMRGPYSLVGILRIAARDQCPRLAGEGIETFEPFAGCGRDPLAANVELMFVHAKSPCGANRYAIGNRVEQLYRLHDGNAARRTRRPACGASR
jgi:hypothetical protein